MTITNKDILLANKNVHSKEAEYYDLIHTEIFNSYEQKRVNSNLSRILNGFDKDARILEIGSGTGNLTLKLVQKGFKNITCIDISSEMLKIMKRKISSKNITTIVSDIDSFLHKNKSNYDIILISSVLHHLPNYEKTLNDLKRVLRSKGVIYITHEPFRHNLDKNIFYKFIVRVDYLFYIIRYIVLIALGKLRYLKRDCSVSDYHTGEKALMINKIKQIFDKKPYSVKVNYYAVAKNSFSASLLNRLKEFNNFEIIVNKK